jgi:hypothetical protein
VASSTASTSATTATRPPVTVRVQWTAGTEGEATGGHRNGPARTSASAASRRRRITRLGASRACSTPVAARPNALSEQARHAIWRIRDRFSDYDGRLDDDRQRADRQVIFAYQGVPIRFRTTNRSKANAFSHSSAIVASVYSRVRSTLNGVLVPTLMTISSPSLITS